MVWSTNQSRVVVINSRFLYHQKFTKMSHWSNHGPARYLFLCARRYKHSLVIKIFVILCIWRCLFSAQNLKSHQKVNLTALNSTDTMHELSLCDKQWVVWSGVTVMSMRPDTASFGMSGRVTQWQHGDTIQLLGIRKRCKVSLWCISLP